jgi:DNA-nicking Smr family endonuclease
MTRKDKKNRRRPPDIKTAWDTKGQGDPFDELFADSFWQKPQGPVDPEFLAAIEQLTPQAYRAHKPRDAASSKPPQPPSTKKKLDQDPTEVDLHGYLLKDALAKVDRVIAGLLNRPLSQKPQAGTVLKIITGKGRHSGAAGGILIREVYSHVLGAYRHGILKIDHPPAQDRLHGLPVRGFFMVTIR